jgi:hypothetical protein
MAEHNIERHDDGLYLNGHLLTYAGTNPTTLCFELDGAIFAHYKAKHGDLADGDKILCDGELISVIECPEPVRIGWRKQYKNDPDSLPLGPQPSDDDEDDDDGYRRSELDERNIVENDEDDV